MGDVDARVDGDGPNVLPRIVVVCDEMSISPMVLAEAGSGLCRIVWVVDGGDPVMGPMVRLLRRIGEVVERAGLHTDAVVSAVASHQPSGILTFAEAQMPFTAAIAERLSLTYHSVRTADRLADKFLQRQTLHDAGLPGPAAWAAPKPGAGPQQDARAIEELTHQVRYPVIVKPRCSTGSVATARADEERQLSDLLTRFGAHEGGLLVEEYLADRVGDGTFADDIAVELLAQNGRVWPLATTGKFKHAPPFRSRGCFLPSHVDATTEAELFDAAEAAVRAVGISDGFANVDLKLTPEGPRIVEVNGRLGGNVHVLMELSGGLQILPLLFRLALGQDMAAQPTVARAAARRWPRIAYYAWIQTPMSATRLSRIEGLDDVAALPHVVSVVRKRSQGDAVNWARGGHCNVSEVFGSVEVIGDLAAAREKIDDIITIEFEVEPEKATSTEAL